MTAPTKPPTAGEIARARRVVSEIRWIAIPTAIERAAETLLAALDAAERERERLRVALGGYPDSDIVSLATTLRTREKVAETAEARVAELERRLRDLEETATAQEVARLDREVERLLACVSNGDATITRLTRERDEARALYRTAIGDETGAILVRDDPETRGRVRDVIIDQFFVDEGRTESEERGIDVVADAVLAALRERER